MKTTNRVCAFVAASLVVGAGWQVGKQWQGAPAVRIGFSSLEGGQVGPVSGGGIRSAEFILPPSDSATAPVYAPLMPETITKNVQNSPAPATVKQSTIRRVFTKRK
jgi:hypothetical protein